MSPLQRSLAHLRENGYIPYKTETWNSFARIRQDLYGVIDCVGIRRDIIGVLGVQTTSGANVPERIKKALSSEVLPVWLEAKNRFVVEGWRKMGPRGKRKLWALRAVEIVLIDGKMEVKELCKSEDGEKEIISESQSEIESENS